MTKAAAAIISRRKHHEARYLMPLPMIFFYGQKKLGIFLFFSHNGFVCLAKIHEPETKYKDLLPIKFKAGYFLYFVHGCILLTLHTVSYTFQASACEYQEIFDLRHNYQQEKASNLKNPFAGIIPACAGSTAFSSKFN